MIASIYTSIAWILFLTIGIGWLIYGLGNLRKGREEAGAEIELAANRKEYYSDEELEGKKLERTQLLGIAFLVIITIGLPLYWVLEPGRQAGAEFGFEKRFAKWGSRNFAATADGGMNCAGCHGGMNATGGVAPYAVTDPKTGEVKAVSWKAPALNTVLYKFSEEEVRFILNYGRPFSPMSAWGTIGGGPLNDQSVQNLIDYLATIQIPREGCADPKEDARTCADGKLPKEKTTSCRRKPNASWRTEPMGLSVKHSSTSISMAARTRARVATPRATPTATRRSLVVELSVRISPVARPFVSSRTSKT